MRKHPARVWLDHLLAASPLRRQLEIVVNRQNKSRQKNYRQYPPMSMHIQAQTPTQAQMPDVPKQCLPGTLRGTKTDDLHCSMSNIDYCSATFIQPPERNLNCRPWRVRRFDLPAFPLLFIICISSPSCILLVWRL